MPGQTNHSLSRSAASLLAPAPTLVRTPLFVPRDSVQGPFVGVAARRNSLKQACTWPIARDRLRDPTLMHAAPRTQGESRTSLDCVESDVY